MTVRWSCGTFGRASLSATWSHWRAEAAAAWSGASAPPIPNSFVRWAAVTAQRKPSSWCWTSTWTWSEGGELKGDLFGKRGGWGRATCSGSLRVRTDRSLPRYVAANISPHLATVHDCRHSSVHLPKGGLGADAHAPQHSGKKTDKKDLGKQDSPFSYHSRRPCTETCSLKPDWNSHPYVQTLFFWSKQSTLYTWDPNASTQTRNDK